MVQIRRGTAGVRHSYAKSPSGTELGDTDASCRPGLHDGVLTHVAEEDGVAVGYVLGFTAGPTRQHSTSPTSSPSPFRRAGAASKQLLDHAIGQRAAAAQVIDCAILASPTAARDDVGFGCIEGEHGRYDDGQRAHGPLVKPYRDGSARGNVVVHHGAD